MNIQGVEILTQEIIFGPIWQGMAAWIIIMCLAIFFAMIWLDGYRDWAGPVCGICFILFIICIVLNFTDNSKTFLNYPSKIEYTIEITDNNAWEKLGPNYTVKEKVYENKEIYLVEGDYVE